MTDLRRELLDDSDAPPELSPDLRFLASRQASLAALFLHHAETYMGLIELQRREGSTPGLRAAALEAAGTIGMLLQQLRSREDLQAVLVQAENMVSTPLLAIDQLFYSLTLLSGPADPDQLDACLPPEGVDELFASEHVRDWLHGLGQLAPGE